MTSPTDAPRPFPRDPAPSRCASFLFRFRPALGLRLPTSAGAGRLFAIPPQPSHGRCERLQGALVTEYHVPRRSKELMREIAGITKPHWDAVWSEATKAAADDSRASPRDIREINMRGLASVIHLLDAVSAERAMRTIGNLRGQG